MPDDVAITKAAVIERALKRIASDLAGRLKRMVGFRNVAVHDDQALQLPIVRSLITERLGDFRGFTHAALYQGS